MKEDESFLTSVICLSKGRWGLAFVSTHGKCFFFHSLLGSKGNIKLFSHFHPPRNNFPNLIFLPFPCFQMIFNRINNSSQNVTFGYRSGTCVFDKIWVIFGLSFFRKKAIMLIYITSTIPYGTLLQSLCINNAVKWERKISIRSGSSVTYQML